MCCAERIKRYTHLYCDTHSPRITHSFRAPVTFITRPTAKRLGRICRSTREEAVHAVPALLTKHSRYFRELLAGEFSEGAETSTDAMETNDAEDRSNPEVEARGSYGDYVEDWLEHYSDSDASYYDEDDGVTRSERENVSACSLELISRAHHLTLGTGSTTAAKTKVQHGKNRGEQDVLHAVSPLQLIIRHSAQVVRGFSARTYKALVAYLQTGIIHFAPLTTASLCGTASSMRDDFGAHWLRAQALRNEARDLAEETSQIQASPKSVYRLADKLGLDDLKERARKAYAASLGPEVSACDTLPSHRLFS